MMNRNEISLHETQFRACRMKIRLTETKLRNDPNKGSHYNPSVFASIASESLPCHFARANFLSVGISAERNLLLWTRLFGKMTAKFRLPQRKSAVANFAFITFTQYFRCRLKRQTSPICSTIEWFNYVFL